MVIRVTPVGLTLSSRFMPSIGYEFTTRTLPEESGERREGRGKRGERRHYPPIVWIDDFSLTKVLLLLTVNLKRRQR